MRTTNHRILLRAVPLLLASACGHGGGGGGEGGGRSSTYVPVECGEGSGQSAQAEIGQAGGTVAVRGHSLRVPPRAAPTRFTITERRASHIGVEVEPHGAQFTGQGATLTLSYARCGGHPAGYTNLRIVEVRSGTTEIIRVLDSEVDSIARTVSTTTQHLSGYLVGGNREGGT